MTMLLSNNINKPGDVGIKVWHWLSDGKEIREKFSGAVEAFSRRNPTSPSPRGDHSKHRSFEEVAVHKDVVNIVF